MRTESEHTIQILSKTVKSTNVDQRFKREPAAKNREKQVRKKCYIIKGSAFKSQEYPETKNRLIYAKIGFSIKTNKKCCSTKYVLY
ncbi:hypothetical protein AYB34_12615 [Leptospira sp. ZV016]|nr:hypothetical protein AYB32_08775 [Leptospira kirschneri]KXZ32778.1 hypothetical protein AYB34_12615 [Leptospira sp. ZV016]